MKTYPNDNVHTVILLVEDDLDIRSYLKMGLSNEYKIVEAENGQIGMKQALEHIPDLIITDVMMPGMNGTELCQRLKSTPETSHIPIIMLTVQSSDDDQLKGLSSGADDYITKPFNLLILKARISNVLKSRRLLREQLKEQYLTGEQQLFIENTNDRAFFTKANQIVKDHYNEPDFNPRNLADHLSMSLRSLQRKLKATLNQAPAEFINEFRLQRAAELLLTTNTNITEITFLVGFEEASSFSRMFKKRYGKSPKLYKQSYLSSDDA
ncbi:MAG: response regulator [Verrucomicrobiota bacterium]